MTNFDEGQQHEIVIVGAGIAGLATALALKIVGIKSLVLERHYELRTTGAALALSPNAWRVLEVLGVAEKLFTIFDPIQGVRVINLETGASTSISSSTSRTAESIKDGRIGVLPVNRKVLLETLAEKLPQGTIRFNSKLVSITKKESNKSSHPISLNFDDGTILRTKVLIGCDGLHSMVAQWLGLAAPIHSGRSAIRGLSVFNEGHGLKQEAVQFVGNGKKGGMAPMNDKEVGWIIVHFSTPNEEVGHPDIILKEVLENLTKDFPPEYRNMMKNPDTESISWAPLMLRKPWDVAFGKLNDGCVTVAGDAMHPMTPDLGQGGCQALEDAVCLARNIALARIIGEGNEARAIENYVKERKWRTSMVCVGAYLSGWIQQGGSNEKGLVSSVVAKFRDLIFHKFIFPKIMNKIENYDCGDLPHAESMK